MASGIKGEQAKEKLIEVASSLFLKKGYSNTGINDILTEAQMSKGSFYFHFSSKKDLAMEVAKFYGKKMIENWLKPISNDSWENFTRKIVSDLKKSALEGEYYGCPIAVLGLEIAFIEKDLSNAYNLGIDKIIDIFKRVLEKSGADTEKSSKLARRAFVIFEGHILHYRISKNINVFDYMLEDMLEDMLLVNH